MAKKKTTVQRRTTPLNTGVDPELAEAVRVFALKRGEKLRAVVEMALRRHMANPPPQMDIPPLPPVTMK